MHSAQCAQHNHRHCRVVHTCFLVVLTLVATDPQHTKAQRETIGRTLWPAQPLPKAVLEATDTSPCRSPLPKLQCWHCSPDSLRTRSLRRRRSSPSLSLRFHPPAVHFSPLASSFLFLSRLALSAAAAPSAAVSRIRSSFNSLPLSSVFIYSATFLPSFSHSLVLHLWPFLLKVFCLGSLEHLFFSFIFGTLCCTLFLLKDCPPPQVHQVQALLTTAQLFFCSFVHLLLYLLLSLPPLANNG